MNKKNYTLGAFIDHGFCIEVVLISEDGKKIEAKQYFSTNKATTLAGMIARLEAIDIDNFDEIKRSLLSMPYNVNRANYNKILKEVTIGYMARKDRFFDNPAIAEASRIVSEIKQRREPINTFFDELAGIKHLTELEEARENINNYFGYEVVPLWLTLEV